MLHRAWIEYCKDDSQKYGKMLGKYEKLTLLENDTKDIEKLPK